MAEANINMAEGSGNKKKWVGTIVKLLISAALLVILVLNTDINEIRAALADFRPVFILLALAVIALAILVSALKWGVLLRAQGSRVSLGKLFRYYTIGQFFNNFLPSSIGGDGVRIYLAGRDTGSTAGAAATVVLERILAMVTLAALGLVSALLAREPSKLAVILMGGVFVVGSALALVQLTGFAPKKARQSKGKFAQSFVRFADNSARMREHPRLIAVCLAESVVFQMLNSLVVETVIAGLGLPLLPLADLFLIVSSSSVMAMLPVGLNGYGLREGSYAYLLAPFGFSSAQALTVSVLYALFVSLYSLSGGVMWLLLKRADKSGGKPNG
ncbi:MAG: flippase-like domain-containing protein [Clostridia bacterium]|nr:flippase-like domain-containing protein [Clostridia bacterium]